MHTTPIRGWGRATGSNGHLIRPTDDAEWEDQLASAGPRGLIVRGGGCGYGDAAHNGGGAVALTTSETDLDKLEVGDDNTVLVGSGTTLGALVRALAPLGWTLPVIPGTGRVTVGGAIAADVHGKNHLHTGTFGAHVREMTVLTPALGEVVMGPHANSDAFRATIGGLGLTGIIRHARLALTPLDSWLLHCTDTATVGLDAMLAGLDDAARASAYAVAWIDTTRRGRHLGSGVISTADPLRPGRPAPRDSGRVTEPRLPLPPLVGTGLGLPGVTATANRMRLLASRARPRRVQALPQVLYPLDLLPSWPRLHGGLGLVQYQFVVPFGAENVLLSALAETQQAGFSATLAVLKMFGPAGDAPMSFPIPGWSLALDFPAVPALAPVLDALDERVAAAGGRIYLVKDSRLRPDLLTAMYPELARWRAERALLDPDHTMTSDLDRRLDLSGAAGASRA